MSELFTLTITLKNSDHQVVMGFTSEATLDAAIAAIGLGERGRECSDDFGQDVTLGTDAVSIEVANVDKQWEFRNRMRIARAWAERKFQTELGNKPDLQFLVGRGVDFGG